MSIATEISRLQGAKADIKTAIEGKGVSVPSSALLDSYPDYIDAIQQGGGEHTYTGHVDTAGLTALGWDADDIQWLQDHVWWDAEDDAYWAVTEANLAFGPNGATPLTWANRASIKDNPDVRYLPKLDPSPSSATSWSSVLNAYLYLYAVPTHGWNTSMVTNMSNMFTNCYLLKSVGDLSSWDTSNVTTMSGMFNGCYSILALGNLGTWDVGSVTTMQNMFQNCYRLSSIGDISTWDTGALTNAGNLFFNCASLAFIGDLSAWDVSQVTTLQSMFNGCFRLGSVGDLSIWDVSNVTTLQSMFLNCQSLRKIRCENWDTKKVTSIYQVFGFCLSLTEINLSGWALPVLSNAGASTAVSPFANDYCARELSLGAKFFTGSVTTFYFQHLSTWSRDSIYESLYTNQTLRNSSSTAVTVRLATTAYDRLSQQDRDDIATKNITIMKG